MAQSELPEATLSKVIEAFQAIHDLVNQASGSKDPQEVQDKFSLIQFGDEEPTVGSVKKQSIFLEEPESTFDTSIERKMTLSGSGVIVDVFEKKDMLIFVLLNHSNSEMNLNKLILGDRKVLEFPTIPQYTAVSVSTTHRWEDFAMLPITWTFETDFGTPASINLIKTK